jgi:hypothetical protein
MNLAPVLKKNSSKKRNAVSVPTEYVDENGQKMISYDCDLCARGMPLSGCSVCRGTGVYSIRLV